MENPIEFFNQWTKRPQRTPQEFSEPTCTVPNQSMTVAQIIAKYSRMGIIPAVKDTLQGGRFLQRLGQTWDGDNKATDPDFDPLDNGQEYLDDFAAQQKPAQQEPVQQEPVQQEPAPAGDGGEPAPSPA